MKRWICIFLNAAIFSMLPVMAYATTPEEDLAGLTTMKAALITLFVIAGVLIAACAAFTVLCVHAKPSRGRHKKRNRTRTIILTCGYAATLIVLVLAFVCLGEYRDLQLPPTNSDTTPSQSEAATHDQTEPPTDPPTEPPTEPQPTLDIGQTQQSAPDNWGTNWEIIQNGDIVGSYNRDNAIFFDDPSRGSYFALPGIATFRGDNYRTGAVYGTANITTQTLTKIWEKDISSLPRPSGGAWTGSGWTGQPLVVQWDEQTKQIMNLYPEKKAKTDLVEVIYATLDGNIYFYDLADGSYTRDPMNVGMAFKGAGALDPRGYPIFYVGSGDNTVEGRSPRMFVISLIDCTILYERGHSEYMNLRSWRAFDSSPLVHAETDTLIWPGENGLLYTIKLNTRYDKAAGTISVNPDEPVMARYSTSVGGTLGYESSAVIVENFIYIADNGGMLFCVDLNTMKLQWAQNVHDDTNATPVFNWEDGKGYLYTGCSTELTGDKAYIMKLDASTGAIVWEKCFDGVHYNKNVSGGVLGSPVLGKAGTDLEGLILYPIGKTPDPYSGILVALDTATGEVKWQKNMDNYCWSSPVALYDDTGKAYVILCDSSGNVHMISGADGKTITTTSVGSNVEASPIVFNDMMVVGTRGQQVFGVKIG